MNPGRTQPERRAILTLDDSPSTRTRDLVDFLYKNDIPALLFVRGARMEENPGPILYALEKGLVLGNHTYSHRRASEAGFDAFVADIEKTEALIEDAYARTGLPRPGKYFRFPHLDRGCGAWVLDFDAVPETWRASVRATFLEGLNVQSLDPPTPEQTAVKTRLQVYLREQGFTYPVRSTILELACPAETPVDWPFTFSTADWMLTARHQSRWPYRTVEDLKGKIDSDLWLAQPDFTPVILAHDEGEIFEVTRDLIMYIKDKGFVFDPVPKDRAPCQDPIRSLSP
jgi:peptidoglycan/xylan/chitin deacetylase (PgdA/CDA1 family)